MSKFKSKQQKSQFVNKLRISCEWVKAGKGKGNISHINNAIYSQHRELAIEIVCESFGITREEFEAGKRLDKEIFTRTPEWEALQRRGFHEGAKIPGSHIRKIDK